MNKKFKYLAILGLLAFVVVQFIRPDKNSEGYETVMTFESETKPSKQLAAVLKENCYDCHSGQTRYPWYSEIAPASYWLSDHIKDGKKHFNVSEWEGYSLKKKEHKLEELIEMVEEGEMPLDSYTWIHGYLEENDKELMLQWAKMIRLQYVNELEMTAN
ncbi:MAG: hypothetical protein ACI86C_000866 [Candidatus Latescibacterota bacterium]|jgi:hypothetical protein